MQIHHVYGISSVKDLWDSYILLFRYLLHMCLLMCAASLFLSSWFSSCSAIQTSMVIFSSSMQLGIDTIPVLIGPVTYLLLSKPAKGVEKSFSLLSLLGNILPIYKYGSKLELNNCWLVAFSSSLFLTSWCSLYNFQGSHCWVEGSRCFMDSVWWAYPCVGPWLLPIGGIH